MNKLFNFIVWNSSAFCNADLGLTDKINTSNYNVQVVCGVGWGRGDLKKKKDKEKTTHSFVCLLKSSMTYPPNLTPTTSCLRLPVSAAWNCYYLSTTAHSTWNLSLSLSDVHTVTVLTLKISLRLGNEASLPSLCPHNITRHIFFIAHATLCL